MQINSKEYDGSLPTSIYSNEERLILPSIESSKAEEQAVEKWLRKQVAEMGIDVICCYQPQLSVMLEWEYFCSFWRQLIWVTVCVWPLDGA